MPRRGDACGVDDGLDDGPLEMNGFELVASAGGADTTAASWAPPTETEDEAVVCVNFGRCTGKAKARSGSHAELGAKPLLG